MEFTVLGAYDNRRVLIRRHRQSAVLADVALGEVLTPNDIYMVLVRVSEGKTKPPRKSALA